MSVESELQSKLAHHEAEIKELKSMYIESRQESAQIKDKGGCFPSHSIDLTGEMLNVMCDRGAVGDKASDVGE